MSRIIWDEVGKHFFETGVDHVVLYPVSNAGTYLLGVPWNGVTSISESPSGADPNKQWADNINYLTLYGAEEYGASIECFTYPDEFEECDGFVHLESGLVIGQQTRRGFGLSYRTKIGNDTVGQDLAYKLHLIYGCRASPSDRSYETINDSPEAMTFSYDISTTPVAVTGHAPTASLTIDSRDFTTEQTKGYLKALEDIIYGVDADSTATPAVEAATPWLPLPDQVNAILSGTAVTKPSGN